MKTPLTLATVVAAIAATGPTSFAASAPQGYQLITDTLGGNGHAKSTRVQRDRLITDTLGGEGGRRGLAAGAGSGFQWGDAGIGAAASSGSLLVLLGSSLILLRRKGRLAH